jgi:hypothetical protein
VDSMPYITQDRRKFLESKTYKELLNIVTEMEIGDMNFLVSNMVWLKFIKERSYSTGNAIVGMLECVKQEFIRQQLNTYEDQKIQENGNLMFEVKGTPPPELKVR